MGFTAKWLLPPPLLIALAMFISITGFDRRHIPVFDSHNPVTLLLFVVAFVWWAMGIRAVHLYWRGRVSARGARDGWRR